MPLLDHFSLLAPYYDRVFQRPCADPLSAHVGAGKGHRLLDVGGGTGRVAAHFVGLVAQVCVVDPSPKMLRECQRKGICVTQGESEWLPFASGSFDRIIVVDAFHHMLDQEAAAGELLRVLAPMGRLVIEEPDVLHRGVKLVALAEKMMLMRSRFFSPEAIQSMFAGQRIHTRVAREGYTAWVIVEKA